MRYLQNLRTDRQAADGYHQVIDVGWEKPRRPYASTQILTVCVASRGQDRR
jgi:hypothetical protein